MARMKFFNKTTQQWEYADLAGTNGMEKAYVAQSEAPTDTKILWVDTNIIDEDSDTIDAEMSDISENPVQNKVIKQYIDNNATKVINNLTSTSTIEALSANQGKVLNEKIGDLTVLNTTNKTDVVKAINEINDKFTNISVAEGSDF